MPVVSTRDSVGQQGLKILTMGASGVGKTRLIATAPGTPLIITSERGNISLRQFDLAAWPVSSIDDVIEAYEFVAYSDEGASFDWVCVDSISDIADTVLAFEKGQTKDPRQAYGALQDKMLELVRRFRDLPGRNVYVTAQLERQKDEVSGAMLYGPAMPGNKLGQKLPYMFDEVLVMRSEQDQEGKNVRFLQTFTDLQYSAKDRSGALDPYEQADLSVIMQKIIA